MYLLSIKVTKNILAYNLEKNSSVVLEENLKNIEAIVVLGGGIKENANGSFGESGDMSYASSKRFIEGMKIYNRAVSLGESPKLIFTGGKVYNSKLSEAGLYKRMAINFGVLEKEIYIEEKSKTTYENGKNVGELLGELKIERVILVTSATHMKRSSYVFDKFGIEHIKGSCDFVNTGERYFFRDFIPTYRNAEINKKILWEYFGMVVYKIKR